MSSQLQELEGQVKMDRFCCGHDACGLLPIQIREWSHRIERFGVGSSERTRLTTSCSATVVVVL